ncbi:MAG: hypothetical protein KC478_04025 [Bacteriovoracaceae bacterium]|nr:hypothetical protein [Bacteriovoracaceae bacterium]
MNLKIFYRSATVWNIILFVFLGFFFLYFQEGLLQARTVFDQVFLKEVVQNYWAFISIMLVCATSVFRLKHRSKYFFLLFTLSASAITIFNLNHNFSKLVTISLFIYLITSYYFYQFLKIEIEEAYYNSSYDNDDLFEPMLKRLECSVEDLETNKVFKARLTNWNPNGCFLYFDEPVEGAKLKKIKIATTLSSTPFEANAILASKTTDAQGFGFRIPSGKEDFGWRDYYSIIDQMGYNVELLR